MLASVFFIPATLQAAEQKFLQFDIPKQRADKALIAFARQTDSTLL